MNLQIEIIDIGAPVTNPAKNGKTYQSLEVAYKRDGKVEGKKLMSFGASAQTFKDIQAFKRGDLVDVVSEKQGEYWQWIAVSAAGAAPTRPAASAAPTATGRVVGSNYETPEERKIKQRFIVRQSALTTALKYLELAKAKDITVDVVSDVAEKFVAFVYESDPVGDIIKMEDDLPE